MIVSPLPGADASAGSRDSAAGSGREEPRGAAYHLSASRSAPEVWGHSPIAAL